MSETYLTNQTYFKMRRFMQYHIYPGIHTARSVRDGRAIVSFDGDKAYGNRLYDRYTKKIRFWIQGSEVLQHNLKLGNSIVHIIDHALTPPTSDLFQYLESTRGHSIFLDILDRYQVYFQFPFGGTIFAPYDDAFANIPTTYKDKIFKNGLSTITFLRDHIIRHPMCRGRLYHKSGWSRVYNDNGQTLELYRDKKSKDYSFVESAGVMSVKQVREGWVYAVSEVLLPNIDSKLMDILKDLKATKFIQYVQTAGYLPLLNSLVEVYTVFAPNNKAFDDLDNATKTRLKEDPGYLKLLVEYHLVRGRYSTETMTKRLFYRTVAKNGTINYRLFASRAMGSIQKSRIINNNQMASNGICHLINKVLIPPELTTYDVINDIRSLRLISKMYAKFSEEFRQVLENEDKAYTLFLPTNQAVKAFFYQQNPVNETDAIQKLEILIRNQHYVTQPLIILEDDNQPAIPIKSGNFPILGSSSDRETRILTLRKREKLEGYLTPYFIEEFKSSLVQLNHVTRNGVIQLVDSVFDGKSKVQVTKEMWKSLQKRWKDN